MIFGRRKKRSTVVIYPADWGGKWPRWFQVYFGPDALFIDDRTTFRLTLLPWPRAEQETGALVRSLAYIETSWVPRRGLQFFRYSPNRADYFLKGLIP